jgi:hypothetical protein
MHEPSLKKAFGSKFCARLSVQPGVLQEPSSMSAKER